jgi:transcriptional regulator with XRE-family HTH domain
VFWNTFLDLCSERGVSPNAVAAELGKSSGSVTAWKNGTVPRETTLRKIADYFGVSVDLLIGREENKIPSANAEGLSEEQARIIEKIKALNAEDFSKVSSAVEALLNIKL